MKGTKEPRTRTGILASGKLTIVKTPEQLTAEKGWWVELPITWNRETYVAPARVVRDALSDGLPRWLRPVPSPREIARRQIAASQAESRRAGAYIGNKFPKPYPDMTPAEIQAELGRQLRRLKGEPYDIDFNPIEMEKAAA